jgi:hypothetical protein
MDSEPRPPSPPSPPTPTDARNPATLEAALRKRSPFASWQIVEVLFPSTAGVDIEIPHALTPPIPDQIGWLVLRSSGPGQITRAPTALWSATYIRLRSTLTSHRATLLLFVPISPLSPDILDPSGGSLVWNTNVQVGGTFSLSTGVWDDVVLPAVAVNPVGIASPMTVITDTSVTGWLGSLLAINTGTPTVVFSFQLPHTIQTGQDINFHIHWVKDDASDVTGTVVWEAKFRHLPLSGTATIWSNFSGGTLVIDPGDVRNKAGLTSWTLADSAYNFGISDIIQVTLQRNGGTSGDAVLLSGDLHVKKARLGSTTETSI